MLLTTVKTPYPQLGIRQNRVLDTIAKQVLAQGEVLLPDAVQLYHAMASLDYTHAPFQAHLATVISETEPNDFNIQQLANCAWAAAVLQETNEDVHRALNAALEASKANLHVSYTCTNGSSFVPQHHIVFHDA
jgi:hypothetical protein